jgi:hypothetical protein
MMRFGKSDRQTLLIRAAMARCSFALMDDSPGQGNILLRLAAGGLRRARRSDLALCDIKPIDSYGLVVFRESFSCG